MKRAARATAVSLVVALSAGLARAQAPAATAAPAAAPDAREAARGLGAQAIKLYDAGDLGAALGLFEKADALYPTPQYRVYVARALAKLGRLRAAVAKYDDAVSLPLPAGAPPSFGEAQKAAAAERDDTRRRLAVVQVDVSGAAAADVTLTVDGEPASAAGGARIELDPGPHRIAAAAPGTAESAHDLRLGEGSSTTLVILLAAASAEARAAAPPPAAGAPPTEAPAGASTRVVVTLTRDAPAPRPRPYRTMAIASGAVGVAGLVVAVVTGAVLAGKRASIDAECPERACTPAGRALIDGLGPVEGLNYAGWITAAVGGAAAGAFLIVDGRRAAPATAFAPAALPGGAGLSFAGRF